MQKTKIILPQIKLIGIKTRTNNSDEMHPDTAKIPPTIKKYDEMQSVIGKIPRVVYVVYTEYETDHTSNYTYFIGEEVENFDNQREDLSQIIVPAQNYIKITTDSGPMPQVCINAWQKIWAMTPEELGGKRSYIADFELYDERAKDRSNTVLDIYISIK